MACPMERIPRDIPSNIPRDMGYIYSYSRVPSLRVAMIRDNGLLRAVKFGLSRLVTPMLKPTCKIRAIRGQLRGVTLAFSEGLLKHIPH